MLRTKSRFFRISSLNSINLKKLSLEIIDRSNIMKEYHKFEEWLYDFSKLLNEKQIKTELFYDDYFKGKNLALTINYNSSFFELKVEVIKKKAILRLFAESKSDVKNFLDTVGLVYKNISRKNKSKRKLIREIIRLFQVLYLSFESRVKEFPDNAFNEIQKEFPDISKMVGAQGYFHHRKDKDAAVLDAETKKELRKNKKYPLAYAFKAQLSSEKSRISPYLEEENKFYLMGEVTSILKEKKSSDIKDLPLSIGKYNPEKKQIVFYDMMLFVGGTLELVDFIFDAVEITSDTLEAFSEGASCLSDIGSCDLSF